MTPPINTNTLEVKTLSPDIKSLLPHCIYLFAAPQ